MDNLKKTKSNDELRSRRQFFKRTAKGILPILGTIVLAGTPLLTQAKTACAPGIAVAVVKETATTLAVAVARQDVR